MSKPYNNLTPAQVERLALLIEECGEVIQAATKVLRHGYDSVHPDLPDGPTNRKELERELGHMGFAVHLMEDIDVDGENIEHHLRKKSHGIVNWLHHNGIDGEK